MPACLPLRGSSMPLFHPGLSHLVISFCLSPRPLCKLCCQIPNGFNFPAGARWEAVCALLCACMHTHLRACRGGEWSGEAAVTTALTYLVNVMLTLQHPMGQRGSCAPTDKEMGTQRDWSNLFIAKLLVGSSSGILPSL